MAAIAELGIHKPASQQTAVSEPVSRSRNARLDESATEKAWQQMWMGRIAAVSYHGPVPKIEPPAPRRFTLLDTHKSPLMPEIFSTLTTLENTTMSGVHNNEWFVPA